MGLDHPKQYHLLAGVPILIHTVRAFAASPRVQSIVLAVPATRIAATRTLLDDYELLDAQVMVVAGGARRQDSVKAGLDALDSDVELVLVHDAARPMLTTDLIDRCCDGAMQYGAVIAAVPVKDTLKKVGVGGAILHTVDRDELWQAQTPQAFQRSVLLEAYAAVGDRDVTDEASLLEFAGIEVHLVEGAETNIKITRPDDLVIAEMSMQDTKRKTCTMRIGHGYDAHRFASGRDLILGGVKIPCELGLAGHSDADVLSHALCDALLGALGEGDIGMHFPDSDASYENIYSITLLEDVVSRVKARGFVVVNGDITVVCQSPKLAPFIPEMRQILAAACGSHSDQINVKATTTEKMGFTGRVEGISCHAVVLLEQVGI